MIGRHKTSNSVKGFGNGFLSRADRGLETTVVVKSSPTRSLMVNKKFANLVSGPSSKAASLGEKIPMILPKAMRDINAAIGKKDMSPIKESKGKKSLRLPTQIR